MSVDGGYLHVKNWVLKIINTLIKGFHVSSYRSAPCTPKHSAGVSLQILCCLPKQFTAHECKRIRKLTIDNFPHVLQTFGAINKFVKKKM